MRLIRCAVAARTQLFYSEIQLVLVGPAWNPRRIGPYKGLQYKAVSFLPGYSLTVTCVTAL